VCCGVDDCLVTIGRNSADSISTLGRVCEVSDTRDIFLTLVDFPRVERKLSPGLIVQARRKNRKTNQLYGVADATCTAAQEYRLTRIPNRIGKGLDVDGMVVLQVLVRL